MLEVILDTETTGLSTNEKHRIVEIGCIELDNLIPTENIFHQYINPQRQVSKEAFEIHGYSNDFLKNKKSFKEISSEFLKFINGKKLIIHNAEFDLSFINYELKLLNKELLKKENVIDTLELARKKYPGSQNSLDALCKRFNIDNSKRQKHNALMDCQLLREVYVNLLDQKEPKLNLDSSTIIDSKKLKNKDKKIDNKQIVIKPTENEFKLHKSYIKSFVSDKNFYD